MARNIMRNLLIILSLIFLLGCVPYSENPLTDFNEKDIDSLLLGTWFWNEPNESGYIHIGPNEKSKLLRVMMVDFDRDMELEVSEFSGHTSSVGGNKYLNLKRVRPAEDEISGYMFVKYAVSPDSLGIAFIDTGVVTKAIKAGTLRGEINKKDLTSSIRITAEQKKLREFIIQKDKELFPEIKSLPKLNLPGSDPMALKNLTLVWP